MAKYIEEIMQTKGRPMNEEYIAKSAAIEAACDAVELFPSEYQEIENAIDRVVSDVALVLDTTEIVDLRAKYQALVAEKAKNNGDTAETYTTGYRYGHRNGQIELLQQILGIFDGVSEQENEL
jgi:hypothetical protein